MNGPMSGTKPRNRTVPGRADPPGQVLEPGAFRPVAGDEQLDRARLAGGRGDGLDEDVVALARDQARGDADREVAVGEIERGAVVAS